MSKCEKRVYPYIDIETKNKILNKLGENGASISGNNPWKVKTNQYGIVLQGRWSEQKEELEVVILKRGIVRCKKILKRLDKLIGKYVSSNLLTLGNNLKLETNKEFNSNSDFTIIDIHTHLFNLKYLPIWGVLASRGVPNKTSRFIEFILLRLTGESFNNNKNRKTFFDYGDLIYPFEFARLNDDDLIERVIKFAESDPEVLRNELLLEAIEEHEELKRNKKDTDDISSEVYRKNVLRWIVRKALAGFAYLRWFLFMTKREEKLMKSMIKNYPQVKTFVFHMMDTEYFFPGDGDYSAKCHIPFTTQIDNMKKLIKQYPNKLKGFVAYNPKRDKGIEVIENALKDGFTGVKFYPPLGYNPIDSIELFQYCSKNKIPVFTHCTPTGFEAKKGYGKNANPKNWEMVLREVKDLKLCLGHAGGVKGWFDSFNPESVFPESAYAKKVVELCTTYENVYTEVGFLDDIENPEQKDEFAKRLQYLFRDTDVPFNLTTKIMYGSDWHVLMNHSGGLFKSYALEFLNLLERDEFNEFKHLKENFFKLNAEKYLT